MQVFCVQYARLLIAIPYSDKGHAHGTQTRAKSSTQNDIDNLTA